MQCSIQTQEAYSFKNRNIEAATEFWADSWRRLKRRKMHLEGNIHCLHSWYSTLYKLAIGSALISSQRQTQLDRIYNVIGDEVSLDKGQHFNSC